MLNPGLTPPIAMFWFVHEIVPQFTRNAKYSMRSAQCFQWIARQMRTTAPQKIHLYFFMDSIYLLLLLSLNCITY